ncbi:chromosome condensation protein (CrcB), putative [Talaromyces stipitatus ATCC 10500]|uniref:Chromosome condensation protein (CrcB), putative n=1 Tax=Talaromyces stipitatus (strain ATCC 10500 / CBS 375.48 / QM 6759 / NRRL 1006) TaxID=441959 RepID=B8MPZ3_TALSN|nr:chromosome condensation protein (CrcB), putative [Talaromyces stipitatus ATCC 10500]EED12883.1 chromosome condensation protein (CrcB), putative [Talaromyces stipitatus ATCC 10500]
MSHSSHDIIDDLEKAPDEENAVAPLSELTSERPVERRDRGTDRERIRDEEQQREQEESAGYDEGIPLAEITSEPPVERHEERTTTVAEVLPPLSAWATRLYTISYLVFFAIWGTLARLGVQALTTYPGAPVLTGVLWANVGGCILMGFFIEDRNIFREEWGQPTNPGKSQNPRRRLPSTASAQERWLKTHKTVKKSIPLYIGLTTGFCGSFTSFSSFMRDAFLALSNDLVDPSVLSTSSSLIDGRGRGDSFMAVVAVLAITVSMSIAAFYLGAHLALALDSWIPIIPFRFTRNVLDRLVVFLGWGCWLGAVFMAIWPPHNAWRTDALFAIIFAPLGCLFRFYMSLALNARIPAFPLGTFAVNIIGTGVLGMCFDLQHVAGIGAPATSWRFDPLASSRPSRFPGAAAEIEATARSILVSCQVLQAVMDGFCGATTTVSTWIAELTSIGLGTSRRRRFAWAYLYAVVSMGVGLGLLVIVMGSVRWSRGYVALVYTTFVQSMSYVS